MAQTLEQKIAEAQAKLARLKEKARSDRSGRAFVRLNGATILEPCWSAPRHSRSRTAARSRQEGGRGADR